MDDLFVFTDMEFKNDEAQGLGVHVPFSQFSAFLPRAPPQPTRKDGLRSRKPTDPEVLKLLQLEYPWLTLEEIRQLSHAKMPSSAGSSSPSPAGSSSRSEAMVHARVE